MPERPIVSFDLDGVLAVWPFGVNPGVSPRPRPVSPLPPDASQRYGDATDVSGIRELIEWVRFTWRLPDPDARATLEALSGRATIVITTGRSVAGRRPLERWLRRHGLAPYVGAIHMSPKGMRTRHHKLATLLRIGALAHVDDDPTAIWYLAQNRVPGLVFREWPNTARTEAPPGVVRIRRLTELLGLGVV